MTPTQTEPAAAASAPAAMTSPGDSEGVHTVVRNETLWGIADRYRPDAAANINQVMLAIYRANPGCICRQYQSASRRCGAADCLIGPPFKA